ncbi:MAG: hypothetical protein U5N26_00615 [Candidatus Marinimicrobia bacterium]|nr:hypothetical protein [Candidatus Neomarinimicrobiota bacterium]
MERPDETGEGKEYIGFYLTGHPLEPFRDELEAVSNEYYLDDEELKPPDIIRAGGIVTNFTIRYDQRNNQYAKFHFETLSHEFDVLAFKSFEKYRSLLYEDAKIYLEGNLKIDSERNQLPTLFLNHALPLSDLNEKKIRTVHLRIRNDEGFDGKLEKLIKIIPRYPGNKVLYIHISYPAHGKPEKIVRSGTGINAAGELVKSIRDVVGQANVWLT